ncbi:MAG: TetR/AcrR family transcriptional regulator [Bacteroidetes bacterium]|jgi:AcrR family transcriptional regulator|nr:TetR/AcrR family transcriptional regulator [Bacteroidota bacterium]MDF1868202.1 TetR/AcrR family transcriptional regulator [Saprospiraceae bacterium]
MKKTKKKIILSSIELFNKNGYNSVRLEDIAVNTEISKGNLHYHFPTKKEILERVLDYLQEERLRLLQTSQDNLTLDFNMVNIVQRYLHFQFTYRFFYRDIFEIVKIIPEAKTIYEERTNRSDNFTKNFLYLSVGRGILKPEPHEGHYEIFSKFGSAILQAWVERRELLGVEKFPIQDVMESVLELIYPYLTEKGVEWYEEMKGGIEGLKEEELFESIEILSS